MVLNLSAEWVASLLFVLAWKRPPDFVINLHWGWRLLFLHLLISVHILQVRATLEAENRNADSLRNPVSVGPPHLVHVPLRTGPPRRQGFDLVPWRTLCRELSSPSYLEQQFLSHWFRPSWWKLFVSLSEWLRLYRSIHSCQAWKWTIDYVCFMIAFPASLFTCFSCKTVADMHKFFAARKAVLLSVS